MSDTAATNASAAPVRNVAYGWGAPRLAEQFFAEELTAETLEKLQKDADAISWLFGRNILPYHQLQKSYDKVTKKIEVALLDQCKKHAEGLTT